MNTNAHHMPMTLVTRIAYDTDSIDDFTRELLAHYIDTDDIPLVAEYARAELEGREPETSQEREIRLAWRLTSINEQLTRAKQELDERITARSETHAVFKRARDEYLDAYTRARDARREVTRLTKDRNACRADLNSMRKTQKSNDRD